MMGIRRENVHKSEEKQEAEAYCDFMAEWQMKRAVKYSRRVQAIKIVHII
jgi:hypothetical protein